MLISHKKRFVMLLPWKTASQSMKLRLTSYIESPHPATFHFNVYLNRVTHQHLTLADFESLPESALGYYTAAFVRNPYDRVYSGFRQLQKDIEEQPGLPYPEPWVRDLVMRQLSDNAAQLSQAQHDFDKWLDLVGDDQVYEAGRNTNFSLHPVHYWTHRAGRQAVSFVGRVESFEDDFERFLARVDIREVDRVNANVVDLKGAAASNPFGYRYVDRMSAPSVRKINRLFAQDFDYFGYERINP